MNAINRQSNSTIPPDLQPYYDEQPSGTRNWARWLTRILAAVIVIVLIFLFVRWAWHQTHKVEPVKTGTSTSQKVGSSTKATQSNNLGGTTDSNDESSDTSTTPKPATTGNSGSASTTVGQSTSTSLTNTGPGETLAVFVAASICFALLYEFRLRQQVG